MRSFDVVRIFPAIEQERITATFAVPTMLQRMIDYPERKKYDCSSLRWILVGAGVVPRALIDRYSTLGTVILQDYGLTESLGPATIISPEEVTKKPDSAGKACFHTEVRIVDEQGKDVPPNQGGEVIIRSPHNMRGYWNLPEATAEVLRDGWLYTGDLGSKDEDGCLYVHGRKKDLIISGGENIYPLEIENVLLGHPRIREVAVIGQPSAKWGESPAAIVVVKDGETLSVEEVIAYCRGKMAGYKVPRAVEFVEEIPRSGTGKAQKNLLRARFPSPAPT
jgi:acyl-CoA synthetase (AMP-forming)/AMP-acid ligase II